MDGWNFAIVNGRLAEIYFERRGGKLRIQAHCYVERKDFKTKREQQHIRIDTRRNRFTYRNKSYTLQSHV